jgi:hypothetical protein
MLESSGEYDCAFESVDRSHLGSIKSLGGSASLGDLKSSGASGSLGGVIFL